MDASSKGTKRKRGPQTKGPCEHGVKYRSSARCAALVRTVVSALDARSAVGLESASTVVSAALCKECGGSGICEHGRVRSLCKEWWVGASTAVSVVNARSAAGLGSASTVRERRQCKVRRVSNLRARSCTLSVQGVRWVSNLRARSSALLLQGVRWVCNLRAQSSAQYCKECGGSQICEHGRERCRCKQCGGVSNLRARSSALCECGGAASTVVYALRQGVRWVANLRARSSAPILQGVRWVSDLRARSYTLYMQGVRWGLNLRARSSAL